MIDRASIMAWNEFVPWTDIAPINEKNDCAIKTAPIYDKRNPLAD